MDSDRLAAKSKLWYILWQQERDEIGRAREVVRTAQEEARVHVRTAEAYAKQIEQSAKRGFELMRGLRRELRRVGPEAIQSFLDLLDIVPGGEKLGVKCERTTLEVYALREKYGYNPVEAITHLTRRYTLGKGDEIIHRGIVDARKA